MSKHTLPDYSYRFTRSEIQELRDRIIKNINYDFVTSTTFRHGCLAPNFAIAETYKDLVRVLDSLDALMAREELNGNC